MRSTYNFTSILKELLYVFKVVKDNLLKSLILSLSIFLIFFFYTKFKDNQYQSSLKFRYSNGSSSAGISSMLSMLGGFTNSGNVEILQLIESTTYSSILDSIIFDTIKIAGKENLLGNYLIEKYDYHKIWKNDELLSQFIFNENNKNSIQSIEATRQLRNLLRNENKPKKSLLSVIYDETTLNIAINSKTTNDTLSFFLTNSMYESLRNSFTNQKLSEFSDISTSINKKLDSIQNLIRNKEQRKASLSDKRKMILFQKDNVESENINKDLLILITMYGEILKKKEETHLTLENLQPKFLLLDKNVLPIKPEEKNIIINSFLVFSLVFVLTSLAFILINYFNMFLKNIEIG